MKPPVTRYDGEQPYVFVSYAHGDSETVFQVIEYLAAHYVRIWYDEGLAPGTIWQQELDAKVQGAHCIVVFVSGNAVRSPHVRHELEVARDAQRRLIPIVLQQARFDPSVSTYLSTFQWLPIGSASKSGHMSELLKALPSETRQFFSQSEQLEAMELGLSDPFILAALRESQRASLGWCSMHRKGEDVIQTCKLCGHTDWFSRGLSPSMACPTCGLNRDPGRIKPWVASVQHEPHADGGPFSDETRWIKCKECGHSAQYEHSDGPPLQCPRCGRLDLNDPIEEQFALQVGALKSEHQRTMTAQRRRERLYLTAIVLLVIIIMAAAALNLWKKI